MTIFIIDGQKFKCKNIGMAQNLFLRELEVKLIF